MPKVTKHVASTDGMIYLHTHLGESTKEIGEALTPYVGRVMDGDVPNNYGHFKRYRLTLLGVDGGRVKIREARTGFEGEYDAFDVFGTSCTHIEPVPVQWAVADDSGTVLGIVEAETLTRAEWSAVDVPGAHDAVGVHVRPATPEEIRAADES